MSRVLVTGARGTLGSRLVEELRERGHNVWSCDLNHFGDDQYIRADVSNMRQLEQAYMIAQPEYIFHLAAEFGRINGEHYYDDVWKANALGTRNVLELAHPQPDHTVTTKVIFASSSEIYGDTDEPILREDMDSIGFLSNDYAISKWTNELQIRSHRARYGSQVMTLRFFNAYGPGEHYHPYRSVCALFCHAALTETPIEVFKGYHRVFMYVSDFIPTLANCVEHFYDGETVNIGGDEYRSVEDVARIAFEWADRDYLTDPHVTLSEQDEHNVVNKRPDISKARTLLKHDPQVELEEGIPKTLDWMRVKVLA